MGTRVGFILAGLLVGCAAGVTLRSAVAPVAGAQASGKRFQHYCVELKWDDVLGVQDFRPDLGAAGWELVSFVAAEQKGAWGPTTRIVACFKRET